MLGSCCNDRNTHDSFEMPVSFAYTPKVAKTPLFWCQSRFGMPSFIKIFDRL